MEGGVASLDSPSHYNKSKFKGNKNANSQSQLSIEQSQLLAFQ